MDGWMDGSMPVLVLVPVPVPVPVPVSLIPNEADEKKIMMISTIWASFHSAYGLGLD